MEWLRRFLRLAPRYQPTTQPFVRFCGEKIGPSEDYLKAAWRPILSGFPDALRAYLAPVSYDDQMTYHVALCLTMGISHRPGTEQRLVTALHQPFYETAPKTEHLDIMLLTPELESQLCKVCSPFYEASPGSRGLR